MALRLAQRQKNARILTRRAYTSSLHSAELETWNGEAQQLPFGPGLTVLCGLNGAGKSSTLGALYRALADSEETPAYIPRPPDWLKSMRVGGQRSGSDWIASLDLSGEEESSERSRALDVQYLDPSTQTEDILVHLRRDDNPEDLLEGVDPFDFPEALLELMSYIVGRRYDMVRVWEVTAFSEDDFPMPYIRVKTCNVEYDLLRMGRGELNAAYMLWRLSELAPGTIVLLEEPESHLAQLSQSTLIDSLISLVVERDITVIASSHAPDFFRRLPDMHTSLISSLPKPKIRSQLSTSSIATHLGMPASSGPLLIVEDSVAEYALSSLLRELSSSSIRVAPIKYAVAGESGVERVVKELTDGRPTDRHVLGVLDGDRRPQNGLRWARNLGYLPGAASPESVFRGVVQRWRGGAFSDWAPSLVASIDEFDMALERLDGAEDHDWLMDLANQLGVRQEALVRSLTSLLLHDDELREQAEALMTWLEG